jgi:monoamine oxidase
MDWPTQPFVMASYSAFGPGQWTDFYGVAGDPVGKLHFAGEHCSLNHQGYLNGAAETGRIAAERILQSV